MCTYVHTYKLNWKIAAFVIPKWQQLKIDTTKTKKLTQNLVKANSKLMCSCHIDTYMYICTFITYARKTHLQQRLLCLSFAIKKLRKDSRFLGIVKVVTYTPCCLYQCLFKWMSVWICMCTHVYCSLYCSP